ncbi:MAG: DUF1939 domain-containing protein, partial [Bacteroidetes bacterium]
LQGANPGGYAVAEYFGGTSEIGNWLHWTQNVFGGDVSMFDFPLRYTLKDMCNATDGSFWMTNLDGAGLVNSGISGLDVSTFVENHDMDRTQYDGTYANGHDPILTNKDMAYAYIIFSEGRPCVWFRDYFAYGLAGKIDTLIWIRQNFLYGGTTKRDGLGPYYVGGDGNQDNISHDLYVARRNGGSGKPAVYLVLNDNPTQWLGVWVDSDYPNTVFRDYIGRAIDKTSAGDGRVELWAPPRGYAIYVPDTTQDVNHYPYILTIQEQTGYINTPYEFQVQAGDPNNTSIDYALSGNPVWLSISSGGVLSGTPSTSDSGTTSNIIVTVTDPLGLSVADTFSIFISNHPIMDGTFEGSGVWGDPHIIADTAAGWDGARAKKVYISEDEEYFYFGADITATTEMNWAFLVMAKYGGGSSESWSRNIVYAHRDLPDYILRGHFQGYAELHSRDFGWWNGVGSPLSSSEYGENITSDSLLQDGWVEGRVLKTALGNPEGFAYQFYLTGVENANATYDACPDDSNTTSEAGATTLRNYATYGTTGVSFTNLQWPPSAFISLGGNATTYGRIYAFEITDTTGAGAGISAWLGYDTANTNPATWSNWLPAIFNVDAGTGDEYQKTFGSTLPRGVYYYGYRYQYNGGAYLYGGYSTNGGGMWDGSDNVSGVLFVEMPPLAPELVSPADSATGVAKNASLQWDATPGATTYRLHVSLDSNFASVVYNDSTLTGTSKTVTGLSNLTQYYWRVVGKNTAGWGAWSEVRMFTTVIAAPAAPTLLSPENNAVNQPIPVQLEWNASLYATSYRILVASNSSFTFIVLDTTSDSTSIQLTSLLNNTAYYWRVNGINAGGSGAASSSRKFTTIVALPFAPALVVPVQGATNQFTSPWLLWNTAANAATYQLVVSLDTNFTQIVFDDTTIADSSKQVSGLSSNTKYFWKVRARNAAGASAYSTVRSFTTASVVTNQYAIEQSWNLVSLPLLTDDAQTESLFPTAVSMAFSFKQGAGYLQTDSLIGGMGYWLKFADTQHVSISGIAKSLDTIYVDAGWNLIGSISSSVAVGSIMQIPSGIITSQYFGFAQATGYTEAASIEPMEAYWVKSNSAGKLVFQATALSKNTPKEIKKP